MLHIFAHAGEVHEEVAESTAHLLDTWYTALPLAIALVAAVGFFAYYLFQKSAAAAFMAVNATLLGLGVYAYRHSTVVSVIALTLGFAMSLASVMVMLMHGNVSPKK